MVTVEGYPAIAAGRPTTNERGASMSSPILIERNRNDVTTEPRAKRRKARSAARIASALAAAAVIGTASPAAAEELTGSVTLYGWLPWIDADVTTGRGGLSASLSGGDVLNALDFTIMATAEAQYGRFGVLVDFVYAKLSDQQTLRGPFASTLRLGLSQTLLTGALTYRVIDDEAVAIDALAGARLVDIGSDISIVGGGPGGTFVKASGDATWVDPVIGVRGLVPLTDTLSATLLADIGGFGAGSDFSWEVFAGLNYDFTDRFTGRLGFRYISIDYTKNGREFDLEFYGPAAGISINF